MNTTTKFFDTKDQYLAFRKAHAAAQNSQRAKSTLVDGTTHVWDPQTRKESVLAIKTKQVGWLQSEHFILLNVIRGKPWFSGFTPKTMERFVNNGGDAQQALKSAHSSFDYAITSAKVIDNPELIKVPSWMASHKAKHIQEETERAKKYVTKFLEPYQGTLTAVDLAKINVPSIANIKLDGKTYVEVQS